MIMNTVLSYGIAEAVKVSGVGRSFLYEQIKSGRLKARKLGRRTLILADDLQSWLSALPTIQAGAQ
ncbi:helix-turn-helix domain-containing protein [Methylobacterium sp. CM6257]